VDKTFATKLYRSGTISSPNNHKIFQNCYQQRRLLTFGIEKGSLNYLP